jgi:ABC-type amino acid transport system permease subunit
MGSENSEDNSTSSSLQKEIAKDLRWTRRGIVAFGVIATIALLIYSLQFALRGTLAVLAGILGSGLLIAVASFFLGTLLGFIFAIPKALQNQDGSEESGTGDNANKGGHSGLVYGVNTNLEQISDWLTKILVGVGLVQLARVPEYARRLGEYFKHCLGDADCSPAIVVTLIVGFLAFGFLAGYLVTRLYVTGALKRAEKGPTLEVPLVAKPSSAAFPGDKEAGISDVF